MKKYIITFIAILIYSCSSTVDLFQLNREYESGRFELKVSDYLDADGLFTLVLKDTQNEDLGKVDVAIVMENTNSGKAYYKKLYTVDNPVGMIDDNYLSLDEDGNYKIYNQGESFGYSNEENVTFFPEDIKNGEYRFQVIVESPKVKIYSNIISVKLPISGIKSL